MARGAPSPMNRESITPPARGRAARGAREAPGSAAEYEAGEMGGPDPGPGEREIDEPDDLGRVAARAPRVCAGLGVDEARRHLPPGRHTRDLRGGIDGQPVAAHRISSNSRVSGSSP